MREPKRQRIVEEAFMQHINSYRDYTSSLIQSIMECKTLEDLQELKSRLVEEYR